EGLMTYKQFIQELEDDVLSYSFRPPSLITIWHCFMGLLQSCVLAPSTKSEKKVRSILEGLCNTGN
ncbi:hypothetical protein Droror1_Dr00026855, partial [Drosera rotundifolia]